MGTNYFHVFICTLATIFGVLCSSCQSTADNSQTSKNVTTLAPLEPFSVTTLDGVLVAIADKAILLSDFNQALLSVTNGQTQILSTGKLVGGTLTVEQANLLLQALVNQKVLQLTAQEAGIDLSETELTNHIGAFLKQQNLTQEQLEEQLKKSGKTEEEYRSEFKSEIIKQQFIGKMISPLVTVTKDEVENYYLQQTGSVKHVTAVKLRSLMLNVPENYTGNALEYPTALEVEKLLAQGKDFVELVKTYSMAANAVQTQGILPSRPVNELPLELKEKLTNLKLNQVVGPLHIGGALFFFQYLGAEFGSSSDLKTNYAVYEKKLKETKLDERLTEYLTNSRAQLHINNRPFVITR